jgi:hypothetical protein
MSFVERWDGHHWAQQQLPAPPPGTSVLSLTGLACPAADWCLAVGLLKSRAHPGDNQTVVERWDGRRWALQTTLSNSWMTNVACASTRRCLMVGGASAEVWDGTRWAALKSPVAVPVVRQDGPAGVSCPQANWCMAVGGNSSAIWDGTRWQALPAMRYGKEQTGDSGGVSCWAANQCEETGSFTSGSGGNQIAFARRWDGRSWQYQTVPQPARTSIGLSSVSCTGPDFCEAAGSQGVNSTTLIIAAYRWDGHTWERQQLNGISGAYDDVTVDTVSCAAPGRCEIGGTAWGLVPLQDTLLSGQVNGSRWAAQAVPSPVLYTQAPRWLS